MSTHPSFMSWEDVNSLIGTIRTHSLVSRPTTIDECRQTIAYAREHSLKICPRGAGRSYGDEALCHEQVLLDVSGMNRVLDFDEENSQITVEGGTRLIDIFQLVHGRLLTLPSSPTESHSTVSGALSANVNGKDGWKQGNFYHQVVRLCLLTAAGEELEVDSSHSLFSAVVSGIGLLGVSLAFGLTVLTMAFAIGHISGCHLNPAVSFGLWSGGRFSLAELGPYIAAQVAGGIAGAAVLYVIASGQAGFDVTAGFASNGYAEHSPGGYSLIAALVTEVVMTFMFLVIILGATDKRAPEGFAPIAIGLGLTLIHLISIPVTNTSVNPARSTGVAIFQGDWALSQLWLFWLAPIVGAILAGVVYRWFETEKNA